MKKEPEKKTAANNVKAKPQVKANSNLKMVNQLQLKTPTKGTQPIGAGTVNPPSPKDPGDALKTINVKLPGKINK